MIGRAILHYQIIEEVGRGGMGIVYRARDTRLDRDVALKFLPPHLSASVQDKARFVQEAKAAATLDHPNICTVYSIEEHEGQLFIVMQFVQGQLLRDRMGDLPEKQAVEYGVQIAEGLAAAHERGIVHRDIKPENIMVRKDGIVQIMDFGLAKLKGVSRLTKEGSTVGTAGYMSPEQVQGLDADHRSDIFSLGVLLYEMFTGELPFKGVHETAVAYEIVNVDAPPLSTVKPAISPVLDAIIRECLEKDPRERTQSAGQIAVDLKRYRRESSRQHVSMVSAALPVLKPPPDLKDGRPAEASRAWKLPWALVAVIGVVMFGIGYGLSLLVRPGPSPVPVIRATIEMPDGVLYWDALGGHAAISPDGSTIAFVGRDSTSQTGLWVRPLNSASARQLAGTGNATYPFWSPEGTSIGFFADGKLKTIDATGGPSIALADAPFGRGGAWSTTGVIVYSPSVVDPNLYAVPANGGPPRLVTDLDSSQGPRFPSFLPDGNHFVFSILQGEQMLKASVHLGSLENSGTTLLTEGASNGIAASDCILYLRQGILMAQPYNQSSFSLEGRPIALQDNINSWAPRAKGDFSASKTGILLYAGGSNAREDEAIWIAADGSESSIARASVFSRPQLSPDGGRIVYDDIQNQSTYIWVFDIARKTRNRITFDPDRAAFPCWSNDGSRVFFNVELWGSKAVIGAKHADGSGAMDTIARGEQGLSSGYYPIQVSPDGRTLLIQVVDESKIELATIDLRQTKRPIPVTYLGIRGQAMRKFDHNTASISQDGKWLAYESTESATKSIFVTALAGQSGKWQVSPGSAMNPIWSRGRIVYFSYEANRNESVEFSVRGGNPSFGRAEPLFTSGKAQNNYLYGTTPDARKYLSLRQSNSGTGSSLRIVVNWKGLMNSR
jgi:Tol biopolymer transport system component